MPSARSRPKALLFPSNSPKAMSVGLASFPRAFFFGHAFGSLRARGFVFSLKLAKRNQRWPCQPPACLFSSVMPLARSWPEALFFPSNSPKAMSVGLFLRSCLRPAAGRWLCFSPQTRQRQSASALPAFCVPFVGHTFAFSVRGHKMPPHLFPSPPLFLPKTAKPPAGVLSGGRFCCIYYTYISKK